MTPLTLIVMTSTLAAANGAAAPVGVITASATSSSADFTAVACLLDQSCKGSWKPGAADAGVDDGIAVRFDSTPRAASLEIVLAKKSASTPFHVSLAGYDAPLASADGGVTWKAKWTPVSTIFLRIAAGAGAAVEVKSIRLIGDDGKALALTVPTQVKASVSASSVLEPKAAYQAAKLFDSRPDQAWATDGAKTGGKGVTVDVALDAPVEVAGLLVWNGYQRSPAHMTANSRLRKVTVKAGGAAQSTPVSDVDGMQRLAFASALPASKTVQLVVDDVVAGDKYKDLVVSELRFFDKSGRVIEPIVGLEKPASDPKIAPLLDKSYAALVARAAAGPSECSDRRMRLRADGSFVFYTDASDGSDGVVEGNWAVKKGALKIFGKKYRTDLVGEYAGMTETKPVIFESDLKLQAFAELTPAQQASVTNAILDVTRGDAAARGRDGGILATASSRAELVKALQAKLVEKKALAVISEAFVDAVLPTDELGPCR